MPDNFAMIVRRIDAWAGDQRAPRFSDPDIKPIVERMRDIFPAPLPGSVERLVAIILRRGRAFGEGHIHYNFDQVMYFPAANADGMSIGGSKRGDRVIGGVARTTNRGDMRYIGRGEYYSIPANRSGADLRILSLQRVIPGAHDNSDYL